MRQGKKNRKAGSERGGNCHTNCAQSEKKSTYSSDTGCGLGSRKPRSSCLASPRSSASCSLDLHSNAASPLAHPLLFAQTVTSFCSILLALPPHTPLVSMANGVNDQPLRLQRTMTLRPPFSPKPTLREVPERQFLYNFLRRKRKRLKHLHGFSSENQIVGYFTLYDSPRQIIQRTSHRVSRIM